VSESVKVLVDQEAMLESVYDVIDTVSECGERIINLIAIRIINKRAQRNH
jgi:hypothetical protein